jgi:hypothetical protein
MIEPGPYRGGFMNNKEDERVAYCSVEEWEAGSIRVARVVVEIDASLASSQPTSSLASKDARTTSFPEQAEQDNNPSRRLNKYLDSVADHKTRHRPSSNLPFHPIVFSLGGMMNGSTTKVFASLKQVMTRGTYNLMLKRLSVCRRGSAALSYNAFIPP